MKNVIAYLLKSRRVAIAFVLLGTLALSGVFAELLASSAPIVAVGPSGAKLLPAITRASDYELRSRAEIEAFHAADRAIWPPVRYGPRTLTEAGAHAPSSRLHPLGTDAEGRDLFARLVYGARTALGLSLGAVLLGAILGVVLGGLAGYDLGFWNDRLVRLVETVDTFPAILVVALVRAIEREPSAFSLVIAVALVRWAEIARLVRAEVIEKSEEDYVMAARALGASTPRIFFRHILPNAIGPVIVSTAFGVASIVLLEAAISFLPLGAAGRVASWGETLAEGARHPEHLRLIMLPGALLMATVGGSYLLADGLRDALDPRSLRARL